MHEERKGYGLNVRTGKGILNVRTGKGIQRRACGVDFGLSTDLTSGLTSWILTSTELKGHCFVCFSFWLRVLD